MDLPLPRLRFRLGRLGSTRTGVFFLGIMTLAPSNCLVNSWGAFVVMNVLRAEHLLGGRFGELFAAYGWVRSLFLAT